MTIEEIEILGVIGAGGAGFPTHVKLNARPDTVIMNAAECEPLLHKDMELLSHHADTILNGFSRVLELTGAREGIIGIKEKHDREIELLRSKSGRKIRIVPLEDVYPAGDEVTLIYMTTGKVVPPGALPISVGCVVQNVETLYNIGLNVPVVDKFISIAGAVETPATVKVPVGTSFSEILSCFKITAKDYIVRSGGLMMGEVVSDLRTVVSKRTGALIVLPRDHYCAEMYRRFATPHDTTRIAKAGCDQCSFCTELCPRFLLGQPVRPEVAMRNRMFSRESDSVFFAGNAACCECNLCTMYSCPEGLDPRGATVMEKRMVRQGQQLALSPVHPMAEYRKTPTSKLMQRLDVVQFHDEGPLREIALEPAEVRIPLNQHLGAPSQPVVKSGDRVAKFDIVAKAAAKVSCAMHASIAGIVTRVSDTEIVIQRN